MIQTTIEIRTAAPVVVAVPEPLQFAIRSPLKGDLNLILNSWLMTYREHKPDWPQDFYFKHWEAKIKRLFEKQTPFLIACDQGEPDFIFGWLCAEPPVGYYCWIKKAFRQNGIAKALVAQSGLARHSVVACTCWTSYIDAIAKKYPGVFKNLDL